MFNLHPFYGSGYRKSTARIQYLAYGTSSLFESPRRRRRRKRRRNEGEKNKNNNNNKVTERYKKRKTIIGVLRTET